MIKIKRVYEPVEDSDGARYLVERLWPRGIKKEALQLRDWLKDAAPSPALRTWYAHDVFKWDEFQSRYREELKAHPEAWKALVEAAWVGNVTLLYAARDVEHNSARVLKEYLEQLGAGQEGV